MSLYSLHWGSHGKLYTSDKYCTLACKYSRLSSPSATRGIHTRKLLVAFARTSLAARSTERWWLYSQAKCTWEDALHDKPSKGHKEDNTSASFLHPFSINYLSFSSLTCHPSTLLSNPHENKLQQALAFVSSPQAVEQTIRWWPWKHKLERFQLW